MQYPQASLPGLPTELRLMILQYALQDTRIDVRRCRKKNDFNNDTLYNKIKSTIVPISKTRSSPWSLLQINSSIRHEAHQLFFSLSSFHFHDALSSPDFSNFLSTIGASAISHIKSLSFHTRGRCTMFGIEPDWPPKSLSSEYSDGWLSDSFAHSSDYCLRDLRIDLSPPHHSNNITSKDTFSGVFSTRLWTNHNPSSSQLCSNGAFGCREQTYEAFKAAELLALRAGDDLTAEVVMKLFEVMTRDNSSSAA